MRALPKLSAILVLALIAFACGSDDSPESAPTHGSDTSDAVEQANLVSDIAFEVSGFAGYYVEPGDPATYVIRSTVADANLGVIKQAIVRHIPSLEQEIRSANFEVEEIHFTPTTQLYEEAKRLLFYEAPPEVQQYWQGNDLDEANNQIIFEYTDESARSWAQERILEEFDVPAGVIIAALTEPAQLD